MDIRTHRLDPAIESLLDQLDPDAPAMADLPIEELRTGLAGMVDWQGDEVAVRSIEDVEIDGPDGPLRLRVYTPEGPSSGHLVLYTHGGGWMTGSVETTDRPSRMVAARSGATVVSVEYRLAPEHPYPHGLEDSYAALLWAAGAAEALGADPGRLTLLGDSSGGNFAAALALMARDRSGPGIAHQILIYPVLDRDFSTPTYHAFADGYFLTRGTMEYFWDVYQVPEPVPPYAAPLRAPRLAGLPPTTIVLCGADPLAAEGRAYAERLAAEGVPTKLEVFEDLIHGAFWMAGLTPRADLLLSFVAAAVALPPTKDDGA